MLALTAFVFILFTSAQCYFPNGRCYDRNCDFSPYFLDKVVDQGAKVCFAIRGKTCTDSEYNCCSKFNSQLNKIVLSSSPACNRSLEMVTLNGIKKGGGVFFDLYGNKSAELRITSMSLSYNTALSTEICIYLRNECNTWDSFCKIDSDMGCKYAIFDPYQHTCCPTCSFGNTPSPSPMPLPPPQTPKVQSPPPVTEEPEPERPLVCNQCTCTQCK